MVDGLPVEVVEEVGQRGSRGPVDPAGDFGFYSAWERKALEEFKTGRT